ncbi:MAG: LLM class flavin-dependent oxidoreductase [Chloroflexi bacterium]|nr:LLM class flavin-dependent oxidoreductase [Chloroflexota bacterium]
MPGPLTLSVLDQSPIRSDGTAAEALRETIELARAAERLGYARYWVSEHHNSGGFAGTAPELLIGQIAANTQRIHVGSGGVMLSHYSALKVAELFRILNSLYPGRIDLGVGRAPGSDQLTAAALAYPKAPMDIQHFPRQILDLLNYLTDRTEEKHPFAKVRAQPGPAAGDAPEVWLLGSSNYSAQLAAALGLPFAFAAFFGTTADLGPAMAELYRAEFQPSEYLAEPKVNVTVQLICAETEERAHYLASSRNLSKLNSLTGHRGGLLPPDQASTRVLDERERQLAASFMKGYLDGDPQQVRANLLSAAERYGTTDIAIVTNAYAFEDRLRSYELVAEIMELSAVAGV